MMQDVTRFYELPIPSWPGKYQMKYVCPRLEKYYDNQSFNAPAKPKGSGDKSTTNGGRNDSLGTAAGLDLDESIKNARSTRMINTSRD